MSCVFSCDRRILISRGDVQDARQGLRGGGLPGGSWGPQAPPLPPPPAHPSNWLVMTVWQTVTQAGCVEVWFEPLATINPTKLQSR